MKIKGILIFTFLFAAFMDVRAQVMPPDSLPVFLADSLKGVYIYADTGTALNKVDDKGRRQGLWEKRYDDGNLRYRGHFWDNYPDGVFKYYYDQGDSLEGLYIYSDDGKTAWARIFYTTGALWAEGKFVNQKEDSIWKFYDAAQRLRIKDQYKEGKLEGKQVIFYESGNPLQIKNWHNNLAEGPYQQYFDEGGIKEEGTFVHDLLQDSLFIYNTNGTVSIKGKYLNDMKEGKWVYYSNDGSKVDTLIYHQGKCMNCAKYMPTKAQTDSLRIHYQQLQEKLDHPGTLEDEYQMPGGEQ